MQAHVITEIALEWYEIGLELEIPVGTLNMIKNERDHSGASCLEMLQMWFNRGQNVSKPSESLNWKNMYDAMRAPGIELNHRAEEFKKSVLKEYGYGNDSMDIN